MEVGGVEGAEEAVADSGEKNNKKTKQQNTIFLSIVQRVKINREVAISI